MTFEAFNRGDGESVEKVVFTAKCEQDRQVLTDLAIAVRDGLPYLLTPDSNPTIEVDNLGKPQ